MILSEGVSPSFDASSSSHVLLTLWKWIAVELIELFLFLSGTDALVIIWNASTEEAKLEIPFPDIVYSVSFNYNGSLFACTCKDKFTRVVDPRKGEVVSEGKTHDGMKPQQCVFVNGGKVCKDLLV